MRLSPFHGLTRALSRHLVAALWLAAWANGPGAAAAGRFTPPPLEELFQTDTVRLQEKGERQVSVGLVGGRSDEHDQWSVPLSFEYGLSDTWQVELAWTAFVQRRSREGGPMVRGPGELEIATQFAFPRRPDSLVHLVGQFSLGIPTGSINRGLSEGFLEYEPAFLIARDVGTGGAQLFAQVGLGLVQRIQRPDDPDETEPAAHELRWSTGVSLPARAGVFSLELSGRDNTWNHGGEEKEIYLTPGWTWTRAARLQWGLGFPIGLNRGAASIGLLTHLVWEF